MKTTLKLLGAILVAVVLVLVVRALRLRDIQVRVRPVADRPVDSGRLAETLAGAVRIPTVSYDASGPSAESLSTLHDFLEASFPKTFANLDREEFGAGTFTLTWRGSDPELAPILLLAHQDVVPVAAGTEKEWAHPPFSGDVAGGFVWGRGSLDDKASLVDLLTSVELLIDEGFTPRRTVILSFGHDEEVGGRGQASVAKALAERGLHLAMVLDEGLTLTRGAVPAVDRPVALVGVAEKGYVSYELVVESEGGHSSMPPRETAISILAAALDRLTRHPLPARADSPAFAMMDAIAPDASFAGRVVLANRWLFRPLVERAMAAKPSSDAMLRTTLAPTILEAGVKDNVLPPRARAVVNLRILPGDTIAGVERELVRRIDDPRVHLERLAETASEPSPASDTDDWAYRVLAQSVREVMPEALVAPGLMIGATDSRHYVQLSREIFRFQPILLAPEDFERFHGRDERIATTNLTLAVRVYCRLLEDAAGAAPSSPDARRIDGAEPQT